MTYLKRMNGADRRNSIIESARPIFAQKGFHGASVREIAKAANVSEALLYKHFASKEDLHKEILNYTSRLSRITFSELDKARPGAETLVKYVYLIVRIIMFEVPMPRLNKEQRLHEQLMFRSLIEDTAYARAHFGNFQARLGKRVVSCIQAAIESGEMVDTPVDPGNKAWFMHHLAMALNLCHLSGEPAFDYRMPKEKLAQQAVFFILRGMGMTDKAITRYFKREELEALFRRLHG